jgi:hypothetical protein
MLYKDPNGLAVAAIHSSLGNGQLDNTRRKSAELQLIEKVALLEKKLSDNEVTMDTMKKEMKALRKEAAS